MGIKAPYPPKGPYELHSTDFLRQGFPLIVSGSLLSGASSLEGSGYLWVWAPKIHQDTQKPFWPEVHTEALDP